MLCRYATRVIAFFGVIALTTGWAAALASASQLSPPVLTEPVDDLQIAPSSYTDRAIDATDHFAPARMEAGDYWMVRVVRPPEHDASAPTLFVNGTWVGVAAPDATWNGSLGFRLEACAVRGAERSCSLGNEFTVSVPAGSPQDPSQLPSAQMAPVLVSVGSGPSEAFRLSFDPSKPPTGPTRWVLDGAYIGEGDQVDVSGLAPGAHRLYAFYATADGPGVLRQDFESRAAQGPSPVGPFLVAGVVVLLLVGTLVPSRVRGPLLMAIVAAAAPRLRRESLLDHFNRGALYQVIKENPGIHFTELRRRVGIGHGTAIWHLRALEAGGLVMANRVGTYTTYFVTGASLEMETYGLTPADTRVLELVREKPGIALPELAEGTKRSLATTSRTVTRLVALGQVTTELARRRRRVYPRAEVGAPPQAVEDP